MKSKLKHTIVTDLADSCKILILFIFLFSISISNSNAQLTVDAGNDTTYCAGIGNEESKTLGGNVKIENGVEPYKISWQCHKKITPSLIITASDLLNDTTLLSPQITPMAGFGDFVLTINVIDELGNSAKDSLKVSFSQCTCITGYSVYEIEKGDSVWLNIGVPYGKYAAYYIEPSDGLSTPEGIGIWCKPDVTTNYNIVTVDTFGCTCSCHAYEVKVDTSSLHFLNKDAVWTVKTSTYGEGEQTYYHDVSIVKDSFINDTLYSIFQNGSSYQYAIRQEGDKIYYKRFENYNLDIESFEQILYDYSLAIGDTFKVRIDHHTDTALLLVKNIDSVMIGLELNKRIELQPLNFGWINFYWIESIGCTMGPLYFTSYSEHEILYDLHCYKLNNESLYGECSKPNSLMNWASIGAKWYNSRSEGFTPPSEGYTKFEVVGEELVGNKQVKTIIKTYFKSYNYDITHLGYEHIYEEDSVVYHWKNGKFHTLYDFTAKPGDKWNIYGGDDYEHCGYDSVGVVVVDSVSTVTINGKELKALYTSRDSSSDWGFNGVIIEQIGCVDYLFPKAEECYIDIPDIQGPLRCYKDEVIGHYRSDNWDYSCDTLIKYLDEPYANIIEDSTKWYFAHSQMSGESIDTLTTGNKIDGWTELWYYGNSRHDEKTYMGKVKCSQENDKVWYIAPENTIEYLIFNLNLNQGDTFDIMELVVDTVFYKNYRKHIEFDKVTYWGEKVQFIEGVGPNITFIYAWGSGFLHPYVVCQFQGEAKVYSAENKNFKDCDLLYDDIETHDINKIRIFPNPTKEYLNIQYPNPNFLDDAFIEIYDLQGRCLLSEEACKNLYVGDLTPGIYIAKIIIDDQIHQFKFIKE